MKLKVLKPTPTTTPTIVFAPKVSKQQLRKIKNEATHFLQKCPCTRLLLLLNTLAEPSNRTHFETFFDANRDYH